MNPIHPITKIVDAIPEIINEIVLPVVHVQEMRNGKATEIRYLVDISRRGSSTLIWTEFDAAGDPVESWQGRYSSYHTFWHMFAQPMPKTKYDTVVHQTLPEPPLILTIPQVIAGYKD